MTSRDFTKLSLSEKTKWVYFNGELITSIRYYAYKVNLYLIGEFYVELFYHHSQDRIEKIELLDDKSKRINFYADQVRLPVNLLAN
ncbi:MAG: hypothetical protein RLO17_06005 [Cyclobacteriaceae bacterium]